MSNQVKTTLLLGALTGLILAFGNLLGGTQGLVLAFLLAGGMNLASYWFSDKIILARSEERRVGKECRL